MIPSPLWPFSFTPWLPNRIVFTLRAPPSHTLKRAPRQPYAYAVLRTLRAFTGMSIGPIATRARDTMMKSNICLAQWKGKGGGGQDSGNQNPVRRMDKIPLEPPNFDKSSTQQARQGTS